MLIFVTENTKPWQRQCKWIENTRSRDESATVWCRGTQGTILGQGEKCFKQTRGSIFSSMKYWRMQGKRHDYSRFNKAEVLSKRKHPNVKSTAFKALTAGINLGGGGRERKVVRSVNLEGDTRSEAAGVENPSSRTKLTHSHSEHIAHAAEFAMLPVPSWYPASGLPRKPPSELS